MLELVFFSPSSALSLNHDLHAQARLAYPGNGWSSRAMKPTLAPKMGGDRDGEGGAAAVMSNLGETGAKQR
jgi:hypothetical protein